MSWDQLSPLSLDLLLAGGILLLLLGYTPCFVKLLISCDLLIR